MLPQVTTVALVIGGLLAGQPSRPLTAGIHMMPVNGVAIRVRAGGLEHLEKAPAIVFEAGARSRLETW